MKKFLAFLLHPIFVSFIGLTALALLIWFAGPLIKFGASNSAPLAEVFPRVMMIVAMLVMMIIAILIGQLRKAKNNQNLVQGLSTPKEDPAQLAAKEQSTEELLQIGERFTQALDTLKNFKFKGLTGSKALYELPWYIIVGPPGSGKTTALINSGLEFPLADHLGRGAVAGVGGTRNCDWWFTNEAVLIDTAGRYTTQDSHRVVDAAAWEGFLELLKRHRRRRPINGAIVAISLQDLLMQTEDERALQARTIRSRLDELMDRLEIRFPIYLMLTKSDMVPGFSDFFAEINRDDREQVWGVSLPDATNPNQGPNFDFLHQELQKIIRRLYDRVLARMHAERDIKRRGVISAFPQQMENVKVLVEGFVRQAFMTNRFKFQPYLRGVYFTSGTQDGTAIDRLMAQVASNFGFAREVSSGLNQQGKSYFLTRLFKEVIFPESEIVGANTGYETSMRWVQRAAYIGMAALMVVLGLVWSGALVKHKLNVREVENHLTQFKAEAAKPAYQQLDMRGSLPALNELRAAASVMDQQSLPWLANLGLYDGRVDDEANQAYDRELLRHFLAQMMTTLEKTLQVGDEGSDLYNTFRVYLMFNKLDTLNKEEVQNWFKKFWETTIKTDEPKRAELEEHLAHLLTLELTPVELNQAVVNHVRDILLKEPIAKRVYSRIRHTPAFARKVDMLDEMGDKARQYFVINPQVREALQMPVLYTKAGYDKVDLSADSDVIKAVIEERSILAQAEAGKDVLNYTPEEPAKVSEQVKDLYFADYIRTWNGFYQSLKLIGLGDVRQAEQMLAALIDPVYSPMVTALQVGAENTTLTSSLLNDLADSKLKGKKGEAAADVVDKVLDDTPVDKYFKDINSLTKAPKLGQPPIGSALEKVRDLHTFVAEIALAPDPTQKAYEVSKARAQNGGSNPTTALRAYASGTQEPLRGWLESLAIGNSNVISSGGKGFVGSEWRAAVYKPYAQLIMGKYPLNPKAQEETAVLDFTNFFKTGGVLDAFFVANVAPFVDARDPTRVKSVDGGGATFSGDFLRQMQNAQLIRGMFFQDGPDALSLGFDFKPFEFSEKEARFSLEFGNERLTYNHGPKFSSTVKWSAADDIKQLRINFEDVNGKQHEKIYTGQWALLRLFDASRIEKQASGSYIVRFSVPDTIVQGLTHDIAYEVRPKSATNIFRRDVLTGFRLPETP
ncbi:MAG TPA: type VI secretion system membrane subunit TssM [Marinagarivorans sp.]|nr:type VI secretion system membrane subunit TssM [Marinagarivorans sp.]